MSKLQEQLAYNNWAKRSVSAPCQITAPSTGDALLLCVFCFLEKYEIITIKEEAEIWTCLRLCDFSRAQKFPQIPTSFCLLELPKFAKFIKHVHSKIGDQIRNTFKLPKIQQHLNYKKKMSLFFPQACTVISILFQRKKVQINVSMSFAESCCSKTIQQCFLGSMSRGGITLLLLLLAKKSELFQSTNGRTSKCYNTVFLELMRGFFH